MSWVKPLAQRRSGDRRVRGRSRISWSAPRPTNVFHSTATSQTIVSLTNGKSYTFKVAAHNAAGWGTPLGRVGADLIGVPGSPTNVFAVPGNASGDGVVDCTGQFEWLADHGLPGHAHARHVDTLAVRTFNYTATTQAITGLTNGKMYSFRVAAQNARGWGQAVGRVGRRRSRVPRRADRGVRGCPARGAARCRGPRRGRSTGRPITAYRVTCVFSARRTQSRDASTRPRRARCSPGSRERHVVPIPRRGAQCTGLGAAFGAVGIGHGGCAARADQRHRGRRESSRRRFRGPRRPSTTDPPVGAYEVIPYHVGRRATARVYSSPATSHVITGLVSGQPYRFRVLAHNSRGWGPMSALSSPVTPS